MRSTFGAIGLIGLLGTAAAAEDYTLGALSINEPVVFATPATARAGGGFMGITNSGEEADRLIAVEGDFPRLEIHTTVMDGDVAKMQQIEGLEIPAGETVELMPGGLHVMFMGLQEPFVEGDKVPVTLVFETAGRLEIEFDVTKRPERAGMSHGNMDHSGHGEMDHSDHGTHGDGS